MNKTYSELSNNYINLYQLPFKTKVKLSCLVYIFCYITQPFKSPLNGFRDFVKKDNKNLNTTYASEHNEGGTYAL